MLTPGSPEFDTGVTRHSSSILDRASSGSHEPSLLPRRELLNTLDGVRSWDGTESNARSASGSSDRVPRISSIIRRFTLSTAPMSPLSMYSETASGIPPTRMYVRNMSDSLECSSPSGAILLRQSSACSIESPVPNARRNSPKSRG
ncbi:MAG: hypothetical protein Q4Q58_06315 [Thermoplasmata archaeon]|nr:hypothetical protein [Thermoplasmata archaeon]